MQYTHSRNSLLYISHSKSKLVGVFSQKILEVAWNCYYECSGEGQIIVKPISSSSYVTLCAIWYHLHDLKIMKNIHWRVLLLVLKVTFVHGCFSRLFKTVQMTVRMCLSTHHVCVSGSNKIKFLLFCFISNMGNLQLLVKMQINIHSQQ